MKNSGPQPSTLSSTSFLEEVAYAVLAEDRPELCAVVLPSFRARAAFYRACARVAKRTTRLPQAFTLSGFVVAEEKLSIVDQLEALAVLYDVQHSEDGGHKGFENFLSWGPVALADFNAVDMSCLDAVSVFKNLKDIKDIEEWSFGEEEWSEDMKRFSDQWSRLAPLYTSFHKELESKGQTTLAMASRRQGESTEISSYTKVFAAGLTAVNKAQKKYLRKWDVAGKLVIMWDGDKSYVEDEQVEAGHFIRSFGGDYSVSDRLSSTSPELVAVDCSSLLSSCQYIREQVMEMTSEERSKTVIVVPDPSSLSILLQSLPVSKNGYNVTMGMSIRETPIYPFINLLNRIVTRGNSNWRYEELMSLVNQPVVLEAYGSDAFRADASRTLHSLAGKHMVWVDEGVLAEYSDGEMLGFMQELKGLCVSGADEFLGGFVAWSKGVSERLEGCRDPWIKAGWGCVRKAVAMVLRLQESQKPCETTSDVWAVMRKLLGAQKIDLLGEPTEGLQIMGLNETRALDYDNVFVLDCNEGMLPKHEVIDSFIPFDLKMALKMPGRYEKEATYAYSFYRLLNRSKKIHFLFKGEGTTNDGTEVSRYILQLRSTFKPVGKLLPIKEVKFSMPLPGERPTIPPLELNNELRKRLDRWSENGMSPSAINKMVGCERNFAYRYLLKLQEQRDIQESMESNTIGSIVHFVFEEGLKDALNKVLKVEHLDAILKNLNELLDHATEKYYNANIVKKGENLLLIESAKSTIKKLIRKEISELKGSDAEKIVIRGIEDDLEAEYKLDHGKRIAFYGLADKLEEANGVTRVVDYKTGITKKKDLQLPSDFEEELNKGKKSKAIQLLVYCAMLLKNEGDYVSAGIRSGRNSKAGLLSLEIDGSTKITRKSVHKLISWIQSRLDILNAEGHQIEHNQDSNFCDYCVVLDPTKNFWA